MPEYGFPLTCIFPCENGIYDTVFGKIRVKENSYSGTFYLVIIISLMISIPVSKEAKPYSGWAFSGLLTKTGGT